jgi:TonB-linked SusC/RagA family outer membrane protein
MKKTLLGCFCRWHNVFGILSRKPMLMLLILSLNVFQIEADTVKKGESISLSFENATLKDVFREIENKTNYRFFYNTKTVNETTKVSISLRDVTIETVVSSLLMNTAKNVSFKIRGDQIMLKKVKKPEAVSFAGNAMKGLPEMEGNSVLSGASRLSLASSFVSYQLSITGTVRSQGGEPIPGVNILQKGTTNGTTTDADGKYSIVVPEGDAVLVFSFIGYATQEVTINGRSVIDVGLVEDVQSLDEVVVVGYGTQSRKDITSAIASLSVGEKKLTNLPVTGLEQLLQGRVSGVNVIQNTGTPGGRSTVRIRGASSITGGNDPLYVVDGIPVNTGNYNGAAAGSVAQNPLANISANDIESIEVLKDASAAAIYGSRASNGVIIITTKRGKAEQVKIALNTYYGFQEVARRLPLLGGPEWGELVNEARANVGMTPVISDPGSLSTTDWQDEIFQRSPIQNHELSFSGGSAKTKYFMSGSYFDQGGVVIGTGFKRGNFRFNLDQDINDRLKAGVSMSMNRSKTDRVSTSDRQGIVAVAIVKSPAVPARKEDGTLNPDDLYVSNIDNPLLIAHEVTNEAFNNRIIWNTYVDLEIIDGLTLRSTLGIDYLSLEEVYFVPPNRLTVVGRTTNGTGTNSYTQDIGWINENTLVYNKLVAPDHRVSAL